MHINFQYANKGEGVTDTRVLKNITTRNAFTPNVHYLISRVS